MGDHAAGDLVRPARPQGPCTAWWPRRARSPSPTARCCSPPSPAAPPRSAGRPGLARHRADGRRPARARRPRRGRRGARRRSPPTTGCAAAAPSTAGWRAPSCGSCRPPRRSPTAPVAFDGDPRARERPLATVLDALRSLGARVDGDGLPFTLHGTGGLPGGDVVIDASASSQFVSGLLLSGARYDKGVTVHHDGKPVPSLPHIEMTVAMLREAGCGRRRRRSPTPGGSRPGPSGARDVGRRARPLQRRGVPGGRRRHRRPGHGRGLARGARPSPARRSSRCWPRRAAAVEPGADGMTVTGPAALRRRRRRPARRQRAHPDRRRGGGAGRRARRGSAGSRTSAATRPTGSPRCRRDRHAGRRRRRDRGRAGDPARAAARRALAGLRRPPDGHGGRAGRAGGARRRGRRHRLHRRRPSPTSRLGGPLRGATRAHGQALRHEPAAPVRRDRRPGASRDAARGRARSAAPTTPMPRPRW